MKTLLTIIGPGASGKSTLTRTLCTGTTDAVEAIVSAPFEPGELHTPTGKGKFVVFPATGFAIAGNLKNGSDSISAMETLAATIKHLLDEDGINVVITDGVRCSAKWNVEWAHALAKERGDLQLVYAYTGVLSEAENTARLLARRHANGDASELTADTIANVRAFRKRAAGVWRAARGRSSGGVVVRLVAVDPALGPADAARQVREVL